MSVTGEIIRQGLADDVKWALSGNVSMRLLLTLVNENGVEREPAHGPSF